MLLSRAQGCLLGGEDAPEQKGLAAGAPLVHPGTAMTTFESVHESRVVGKLVAIDRLILKGHLNGWMPKGAFARFLWLQSVLFVGFKTYVTQVTERLKAHAQAVAQKAGRSYEYLKGAHTAAKGCSKEDLAREIAERDGIREGLVAVFATVEGCMAFSVRGNRETHKLEVVYNARKCLHLYFYIMDREFGLIHVRLQTWFPFAMQVYVNGHEWLCRELERRGVGFQKSDNKILQVDDLALAQKLAKEFAERKLVKFLDALARRVNPFLQQVRKSGFGGYYWVIEQCEVSTDVVFKSRKALAEVLPECFEASMTQFSAVDALRFLGRKLHPSLKAEVTSDQKGRAEGQRVKYRVGRNSVKMYDHVNVLRIETTINKPGDFKALRVREVDGKLVRRWEPMTKGVGNLKRFFDVGAAANDRYLDALGAVTSKVPRARAIQALDDLSRPHTSGGRHVPRLQPISPQDCNVFQAVLHGEHAIHGFRNRDIAKLVYPKPPPSLEEKRRRSAHVSRLIIRLRGHALVAKVKDSHLYRITAKGMQLMTTAVRVRLRDFPEQYAQAAA
jgi:hypothetical protein